jgi:extradiol dioxygenase family protein
VIKWPVRIAVAIVLIVVLAVDLGSPLFARVQLGATARDAAKAAAVDYFAHHDPQTARQAADQVARDHSAGIDEFSIDTNTVHVKMSKEAWSLFMSKLSQTKDWYHVTATADAVAQP